MPRKSTERQLYEALLDRYGERIARAFIDAIADLRKGVDLQAVIAAVEIGDIESAIRALKLDPAAFAPVLEVIRAGYVEGGTLVASGIRGATAIIRFDVRNPRAEQWLREQSSTLVTRILDDQRDAVRQRLEAGMVRGDNPRTTALDVVGRVNRVTGQREAGVLGLTAQQEGWARSYEDALRGDVPDASALIKNLRDKRFDRTVAKAIREGVPIPAETRAKMVSAYRNRALRLRGETIGRTESLTSLRAAKHEAYRQAVESGSVQESAIRRTWRSAGDLRVRHTHTGLNGETVGMNQPFVSPSGARLMYPGDPSAPAEETIRCRCDVNYRIDFLANLG